MNTSPLNKMWSKISPYLTFKNIIGVGIFITILMLLSMVDSCKDKKYKDQYQSQLDSLILANQTLVVLKNKSDQKVIRQTAIVTDNQKALKEKAAEIFNLKKRDQKHVEEIKALITIKTKVRVDSIEIAYVDKEERKRFSDSLEKACKDVIAYYEDSTIKIGQKAKLDSLQNPDLQMDATITKTGIMIDSAVMPDNQAIAIYESKNGLLRRDVNGKLRLWTKPSLEVQVTHTNKYIHVTGMNSMIYQPKVKGRWLERLALVAAGIVGTILILK